MQPENMDIELYFPENTYLKDEKEPVLKPPK